MKYVGYFFIVLFVLCGIIWGCSECKARSTNNKRENISLMLSDVQTVSSARTIAYVDPTQTDDGVAEIFSLADRYSANRTQTLGIVANQVSKVVEKLGKEGFKVAERNKTKLGKIIEEHDFQMSEWSSEKKSAEVGLAENADLILTFVPRLKPSDNGSVYVSVTAEFLDINTMQTTNFNYDESGFSNWNFLILKSNEDSPNGLWYCDGVKKSTIKYTKNTMQFITPFAGNYALDDASRRESKKYSSDEIGKIYIYETEGNVVYSNGKEENVSVNFSLEKARTFATDKVTYEDYLDKNIENYSDDGTEVSTLRIGNIRIRGESGKQILNGKIYRRGNEMGILLGTSEKNGTGYAYFMMFSK